MNPREIGFLLLSSELGIPGRRVLTPPQLRTLAQRAQKMPRQNLDGQLTEAELLSAGYNREMAQRILVLLEDEALLEYYCQQGALKDCYPLSRVTPGYPLQLRKRLGLDSPGCLWYKGDRSILDMPKISLVGSRDLAESNARFAREVGIQAAKQGFALVSGNARGADQQAQNACLAAGGKVISVVSDALADHPMRENVLWLSENGFSETFSAKRALSRNRVIHGLGQICFVAQCGYQKGGTWDGTVKNLRFGWSPVYCFHDASDSHQMLETMGAQMVDFPQLQNIHALLHPVAQSYNQEG